MHVALEADVAVPLRKACVSWFDAALSAALCSSIVRLSAARLRCSKRGLRESVGRVWSNTCVPADHSKTRDCDVPVDSGADAAACSARP